MRNYSSVARSTDVFHWETTKWGSDSIAFCNGVKALLDAFETSDIMFVTPSEQSVLDDFKAWVDAIHIERTREFRCEGDPDASSFVYCNINTGRTLVFVACTMDEYSGQMRTNCDLEYTRCYSRR